MDEVSKFTHAAEVELLRLLRRWGDIDTPLAPGVRRVIEAALLTATVHALLDVDDDNARCEP